MKVNLKSATLVLMLLVVAMSSNAQVKNMSNECKIKYSTYKEYAKKKYWDEAWQPWVTTFTDCPDGTKTIYSDGEKLYTYLIKKNRKNKARYKELVDTLIMLYDKRIEYFGNDPKYGKGYILDKKGRALWKYRKKEKQQAYDVLAEAMKLNGSGMSILGCQNYFQATVDLFKDGAMTSDQVLENYGTVSDALDTKLKTETKPKNIDAIKTVQANADELFAGSGAASCDNLEKVYSAKYEASPDDVELIKKIMKQLNNTGCTESEFFMKVAEKLYALEPSSTAARFLAKVLLQQKNYEKAVEYYEKSATTETDSSLIAEDYMTLAALMTDQKQKAKARTYALNAAKHKANWGKPYILIAKLYASSSKGCGSKPIEQKSVFWAANDKLNKAKSIDPSVASEAGSLIGQYSRYYPTKSDAFFIGLTNGQTYKVGCWIQESTTVRTSN